jgi:hypothetical protein
VLHDDRRAGCEHRGQLVTRRALLDRWNEALRHRPGHIKLIIDFSHL